MIGAVAGGIIGYATTGTLQGALSGDAIGGVAGLTLGAGAGVLLAGSATATTLAVSTGFTSLAVAMQTGGLAAGGAFLLQNMRNATAQYTVLGSYPGYLELAEKLKARVFSIPTNVWNRLSPTQQWNLNLEFLDKSIARGHEFIFSVNLYSSRITPTLQKEVDYLLTKGYVIVEQGWKMIFGG